MLVFLFGGYARLGRFPSGQPCEMHFLTRRGAERYGRGGLSALDPYARLLGKMIVFIPGKIARKKAR